MAAILLSLAFLILVPITLASNSFGYNRFYYQSLEYDKQSFYVSRPFNAYFTSIATNVTWNNPSGNCTISTPTANATFSITVAPSTFVNFTCSFQTTETFNVYPDNDSSQQDTFYVKLETPPCFRWYMSASASNKYAQNSTITAKIWVIDPLNADANELANTATIPSDYSKDLTAGFYSIGEKGPLISNIDYDLMIVNSITYLTSGGYWIANLTTAMLSAPILVSSSTGAAIMGCSIEPIFPLLYLDLFPNADFTNTTTATAASSNYFNVYTDPCSSSISTAISSLFGNFNFIFSKTAFGSDATVLSTQSEYFSNGVTITGLVSTISGSTIVSSNGTYFMNTISDKKFNTMASFGLTAVDKIKSIDYCDVGGSLSGTSNDFNSVVVVWKSTEISNSTSFTIPIYVSLNGGYSYTSANGSTFDTVKVNVAISLSGSGGYIRDIAIQHTFQNIAILVRDASGYDRILFYNLQTKVISSTLGYSFQSLIILDGGVKGSLPGLVAMSNGELLAYGDDLYYSPNGGISFLAITLKSRDSNRPAIGLSTLEYIKQVVAGKNGEYAAITSTNRVFLGQTALNYAIELVAGLSSSATAMASLSFDSYNRLIVYTPQSIAPFISSRIIPTTNQIKSPKAPITSNYDIICPFFKFNANLSSIYYLDVKDRMIVDIGLTPKTAIENQIAISISNSSVIKYSSNITALDTTDNINGESIKQISGSLTISAISGLISGRSEFEIRPKVLNQACSAFRRNAIVFVGCPTSKSVHFVSSTAFTPAASPTPRQKHGPNKKYATTTTYSSPTISPENVYQVKDCSSAPTSVTISSGKWISNWSTFTWGSSDKVISYDCEKYGVPFNVYYGSPFTPQINLYISETFVERVVNIDMAIWEDYGQNTFTFNTTMEQAGCKTSSQNIYTFLNSSVTDISEIWTSSNYKSCFDTNSTAITDSQKSSVYPILNGTNYNSIKWNGGENGYYFFTIRVMDSEYSYCTLTANFAVYVYGAPMSVALQSIILVASFLGIVGLMIASYFWQKATIIRERAKIKDE